MNKMRIETWLTGKCLDKHDFLRMVFSDVAVYFADFAPKLTIYDWAHCYKMNALAMNKEPCVQNKSRE